MGLPALGLRRIEFAVATHFFQGHAADFVGDKIALVGQLQDERLAGELGRAKAPRRPQRGVIDLKAPERQASAPDGYKLGRGLRRDGGGERTLWCVGLSG